MKALVLNKIEKIETAPLQLQEVPLPEPKNDEVLVKVLACGVCRTDLHVIEGDIPIHQLPLIPGHQVVGKVVKGGFRFKEGDRVGIAWLRHTCQECSFCNEGKENLCKKSLYTGYDKNGGYAEYAVAPEDYLYPIPESFSDAEAAPLLCAGIVGYRALKQASLPPGGRLGIYGFGSSAHLIFQIAKYLKSEIYVATRDPRHQALAKEMGATWIGAGDEMFPCLMDSIIIFAPAGELVPIALRSLKPGGVVSLAGIHMSDIPSMTYNECLFHEKELRSVESNTRQDGEEFLALAQKIPIKPHITLYPLEKANEALLDLKHNKIQGTAILIC